MKRNQISGASSESSHPYSVAPKGFRLRDIPERQRPRELAERFGVDSVSDDILLAIILRSGAKGLSVIDLARQLLKQYGSLTAMARAPVDEFIKFRGMGKIKAQVLKSSLELAKRLSEESTVKLTCVKTPEDAARLLREKARTLDKEVFWVLLLNTRNSLKCPPMEITRGLLDASLVHPREVFRDAIQTASAAIVLVHNHPSGDAAPSAEDIRITKQLVKAGRVIEIQVLDHIILGRSSSPDKKDFFSMREAGIVEFA